MTPEGRREGALPFESAAEARRRAGGRPLLLDLFSGAGGAARGYKLAGFYVVGIDNRPQPRYAGDEYQQADALTFPLDGFDAIHASPPCQGYSRLRHLPWLKDRQWPLLIESVRERLEEVGIPWVIENVTNAPLSGIFLCGLMFGLPVYRHRLFESSEFLMALGHPRHEVVIGHGRMVSDRRKGTLNAGSSRGAWGNQTIVTVAGGQYRKADGERALGVDWMTKAELNDAIPPAYTSWIGSQLLRAIAQGRVNACPHPEPCARPDPHDLADCRCECGTPLSDHEPIAKPGPLSSWTAARANPRPGPPPTPAQTFVILPSRGGTCRYPR